MHFRSEPPGSTRAPPLVAGRALLGFQLECYGGFPAPDGGNARTRMIRGSRRACVRASEFQFCGGRKWVSA